MVTECPTCRRRAIDCPGCGRVAVDDSAGRLPVWCEGCGAMLKRPEALEESGSHKPAARFLAVANRAPLPGGRKALIAAAAVCGLLASVFTYNLLPPPRDPPPGHRIVRETYSVQPSDRDWRFAEERWRADRSDLALESTSRGTKGALLIVHVIRAQQGEVRLNDLAEATRLQWSESPRDWRFLDQEGGPAVAAGRPAERIVAISDKGDRVRREALIFVQEGIGYRLTAEYLDISFDRIRDRFDKFVASFRPASEDDNRP